MGSKGDAIKQRIIEKADELFYQRGYEKTTFSDIASAINISRGNFYYHYKTKDEILDAVIQSRLCSIQKMLNEWEQSDPDPRKLIHRLIDLMTHNTGNISQYGCPVGTLCLELSKIQHAMRDNATQIFSLLRNWLIKQFGKLDQSKNPDQLAMHLLTRTQGLSTMMTTFDDDFYVAEIQALKDWVDEV
jgi:TetR/AcrR family transcriptional regulator, transcriptional repressor for nem operon